MPKNAILYIFHQFAEFLVFSDAQLLHNNSTLLTQYPQKLQILPPQSYNNEMAAEEKIRRSVERGGIFQL